MLVEEGVYMSLFCLHIAGRDRYLYKYVRVT